MKKNLLLICLAITAHTTHAMEEERAEVNMLHTRITELNTEVNALLIEAELLQQHVRTLPRHKTFNAITATFEAIRVISIEDSVARMHTTNRPLHTELLKLQIVQRNLTQAIKTMREIVALVAANPDYQSSSWPESCIIS